MKEKILVTVLKYTESGKEADENFIYDICKIIIDELNLTPYVKDIKIISNSNFSDNKDYLLAEYIYYKRLFQIRIYINEFSKYFNNNTQLKSITNAQEQLFYKNLFFVEIIRHELEHSYQEFLKEYSPNIEGKIINATTDPYGKALEDYYKMQNYFVRDEFYEKALLKKSQKFETKAQKYYEYDPKERLAYIKARMLILELAFLAKNYFLAKEINNRRLNYVIYHPYENVASPTIYFSQKMHLITNLEQFSWYNKNRGKCLEEATHIFSFPERILLGLPLSPKERDILYNEYRNNEVSSLIRKKS